MMGAATEDPSITVWVVCSITVDDIHHAFVILLPYILFDQRRVDIIDQVEHGVHDRLHIYPRCGIFYFPWRRHQIEGTNGF